MPYYWPNILFDGGEKMSSLVMSAPCANVYQSSVAGFFNAWRCNQSARSTVTTVDDEADVETPTSLNTPYSAHAFECDSWLRWTAK